MVYDIARPDDSRYTCSPHPFDILAIYALYQGVGRVGELSIVRLLVLTAVMWGAAVACSNDTPVPPITPDLIQPTATTISAGGDHTCALRPDGSPVCWGSRQHGQAPWTFTDCLLLGPPSLGCPRFTAITSGGAHTCGLGPDGSWMCWGSYFHSPHMLRWWEHREGILGPGSPYPEELEPPERQERFRAISSGLGHACALRSNGEAVCWGANSSGQASAFEGEPVGAISSGRRTIHARFGLTTRLCAGAKMIGHGM